MHTNSIPQLIQELPISQLFITKPSMLLNRNISHHSPQDHNNVIINIQTPQDFTQVFH